MRSLSPEGGSQWEQGRMRGHPDNPNSFLVILELWDMLNYGPDSLSSHRLTTKQIPHAPADLQGRH